MSVAQVHEQAIGRGNGLPVPKKWTGAEYDRLVELGTFAHQRVELINGEVWQLSPMSDPHAQAIQLVVYALLPHFPSNKATIRVQMPMRLCETSRPEPDVVVVAGTLRQVNRHPGEALLVVEVSDTTLEFDRGVKAALYAQHGIGEYWIVNLPGRCVEVHRSPIVRAGDPRYGDIRSMPMGQSIQLVAAPQASIAVADLLP